MTTTAPMAQPAGFQALTPAMMASASPAAADRAATLASAALNTCLAELLLAGEPPNHQIGLPIR